MATPSRQSTLVPLYLGLIDFVFVTLAAAMLGAGTTLWIAGSVDWLAGAALVAGGATWLGTAALLVKGARP